MKKLIIYVWAILCSVNLFSQDEKPLQYKLISSSDLVGITALDLLDPYLSPLMYTGSGVKYEHAERKFFSAQKTNLSMEGKISALAGITTNPANTSSMIYLGAIYSWGMHYHFRILPKLQILAGGTADAGFGYKSIARNVNNPVNLDLSANLNLSGIVRYDIPTRRRVLRLSCELEIPVFGYMFVPQGGASYYEMFELGSLSNAFHFSSLHNKLGSSGDLILDIPFKHFTWRLGVNNSKLKYEANNMVFKHNEYSLMIGCKYDLYVFAGKKNRAPENFISTDK